MASAMTIKLDSLGKRFTKEWIFNGLSYNFEAGGKYAVLGPNGSGKSTLLQVISAAMSPSAGYVDHYIDDKLIEPEQVYQHISYCAPYIQLIEELTLAEHIEFHQHFRPLLVDSGTDVLSLLNLQAHKDKQVKFFSSGMKQRLKLGLAILSESQLLLLDEPATNLDKAGIDWFKALLEQYLGNRILIVSSNRPDEYDMCDQYIDLINYK